MKSAVRRAVCAVRFLSGVASGDDYYKSDER